MSTSRIKEIVAEIERRPDEAEAAIRQMGSPPLWFPTPGPQFDAYYSKADVLLYGGSGGSGKTDLCIGLAFTAHQRSLILRRQYVDMSGIIDRAIEVNGTRDGFSGAIPPRLNTTNGRLIQFGAHKDPGDENSFQGIPFDLKVFDEAVQHLETQVQFHLGWVRSASPNQRTRVVLATNPPVDASGDWVIKWFRPWLDLNYDEAKRAKHGELRWYITNPDGEEQEVDGPEPLQFTVKGELKTYIPKSRTFIPGKLNDNPFLVNTGYQATLDAMPEPLRTAIRDGNFMATRTDAERQVIPTAWIDAAMLRWKSDGGRGKKMTAMGYDPSGGGEDPAMLALRHEFWYAPLIESKGRDVTDGSMTVAHLFQHRRDSAEIVIDVGGGYAGQTVLRLKDNNTEFTPFSAQYAPSGRDRSGKLTFYNKRAEVWWKFREALDPDQPGGAQLALPPDQGLKAELSAPTFKVAKGGITVEAKDEIRKRLGRSTNRADAVIMAWSEADAAVRKRDSLGLSKNRLPSYSKPTRNGALQRRRGH